MAANAELMSSADTALAPGTEDKVMRALDQLTAGDVNGESQSSRSSVDSGVNTDPDWEDQVRSMLEYSSKLTQEFNVLKLKQQQDELEFNKARSDLEKKKEEAIKQHQTLLEKLESVRVKLQLNNSKATRKNFLSKKQEMTSERSRAQEERDKLSRELEECEARLASLDQEQKEEQRQWDQDLSELRLEMERAQREARDAQTQAQKDERAAVDRQRDTAMERIEAWLTQVSVYLNGLQAELPHKYRLEKPQWEKKESLVRKNQAELQTRFREVLQQLQEGKELESLPRITVPALPQVPMSELYFSRIMQMTARPQAPPLVPPPSHINPISRPRLHHPPEHAHFPPPHPQPHPPFPRQRFPHHSPSPPVHLHSAAPPRFSTTSLPVQASPPHAHSPPPPYAQAPPTAAAAAAAGKLDKVLDKLGVHFPLCSRAHLTWLLQQVKTERGTLAGLSMEDVVEQVGQRLAQRGGAVAANTAHIPGPIQRPFAGPGPAPRKPCLVCQKPVDHNTRFMLKCNHTLHRECIQVWLQSSKSNTCPFCPNK